MNWESNLTRYTPTCDVFTCTSRVLQHQRIVHNRNYMEKLLLLQQFIVYHSSKNSCFSKVLSFQIIELLWAQRSGPISMLHIKIKTCANFRFNDSKLGLFVQHDRLSMLTSYSLIHYLFEIFIIFKSSILETDEFWIQILAPHD
jgi:hypothetical protein